MDAVVKIGGSLAKYPEALKRLCEEIGAVAREADILVVPGGGPFADAVRALQAKIGFSDEAAHSMALIAMRQYGLLLKELIPNSVGLRNIEECMRSKAAGRARVLLSFEELAADARLEKSWRVTSDTIALYIAHLLGASRVVLVKDVDGVYVEDPKKSSSPTKLYRATSSKLRELGKTCLDEAFADFISSQQGPVAYVVSGFFPDKVRKAVLGEAGDYTVIEP